MRQFAHPAPFPAARGPVTAAAALALAAALLTGCASRPAATAGTAGAAGESTPSATPGPCGTPLPQAPGAGQDGARITATGPACAAYEVTNPGGEPADVTVTFSRLTAAGAAMDTVTRTVPDLAPGATATGQVDLDGHTSRVKIIKVRSVPAAEAPRPDGPCPASGLRLSADDGDAAMGLRVVGLHLRNCGTATVTVNGYPDLQPLDKDHHPLDAVSILHGGSAIATGTGADDPPRAIALRPGEGARSTLVWRNTTGAGDPVDAPYVRVRAVPGAAPVTLTPELDLGTTGRLGVGAWTRDGTRP